LTIPIKNLYYLLSYVWDVNWDIEWKSLDVNESENALDLLAKILIFSTDRLIKKGLYRGYIEKNEEIFGVRGRIDISSTIKRNGFSNSKLTCNFEELDYSVLHNRIIKATLENLSKTDRLDKSLKEETHALLERMRSIESIHLSSSVFSSVSFHSNIRNYRLPISICQLIHNQLLPSSEIGKYKFSDISDEKLFKIFERFIFNFYKKHLSQTEFSGVKKESLIWQDTFFESGIGDLLPWMETDVCLYNKDKRLIVECKFYKSALQSRQSNDEESSGKFISAHLYQLYAYLKNLKIKHNCETDGMLIYPENGRKLSSIYSLQKHRVLIKTIDLNMTPELISADLLKALEFTEQAHTLAIN